MDLKDKTYYNFVEFYFRNNVNYFITRIDDLLIPFYDDGNKNNYYIGISTPLSLGVSDMKDEKIMETFRWLLSGDNQKKCHVIRIEKN